MRLDALLVTKKEQGAAMVKIFEDNEVPSKEMWKDRAQRQGENKETKSHKDKKQGNLLHHCRMLQEDGY